MQQKRILIIDDEMDVTITLRLVLEHYGFMTYSYNDPVLAYNNFRDGLYDLVLLDIKMPVVNHILQYLLFLINQSTGRSNIDIG